MTTHHAVVWIDHNETRALALDVEGTSFHELAHVHDHDHTTHSKKNGGHRHPADPHYLKQVEAIIGGCTSVVLVGPSNAKDELVAHLERTAPALRPRIVAVSSLDRVTDGELAAHARKIFRNTDEMKGIHVDTGRDASRAPASVRWSRPSRSTTRRPKS